MLRVHLRRGMLLAIFYEGYLRVKELSIFVDESGDFGEYNHISPYYIVTLITHEQKNLINEQIKKLNLHFDVSNTNIQAMHTAPLIRRESIYKDLDISERRKMFRNKI